jgi:hypothetical protein
MCLALESLLSCSLVLAYFASPEEVLALSFFLLLLHYNWYHTCHDFMTVFFRGCGQTR